MIRIITSSRFQFVLIGFLSLSVMFPFLFITVSPKQQVRAQGNSNPTPNPIPRPTPGNTKTSHPGPSTQTMYAPITGLPDSSGAELVLNSNSAHNMDVTPTFYKSDGTAVAGQTLTLNPSEVRHFAMSDLFPPNLRGQNKLGGLSLSYFGGMMEVVAQITLFGQGRAGSVDIPFSATMDYHSLVQEAVWWMPNHGVATIILGNGGETPISAHFQYASGDSQTVQLDPHATVVLDHRSNGQHNSPSPSDGFADSLRFEAVGPVGSLRVTGFVRTDDKSFTSGIHFYDPQTVRQPHLFATDLRVQNATPHLTLKNTSDIIVTARPRFLPPAGGSNSPLELAPVTLAPRQAIEVDLNPLTAAAATRSDMHIVSVQVLNDGPAGSLIGGLCSANGSANKTYDVPLRDSGPVRNSTGSYPWRIDGDYTSTIFITNVGSEPAKFVGSINYDGGTYRFDVRELVVGETAVFSLNQLRDQQIPDKDGHVLPHTLQSGQFRWSVIGGHGASRLIGRTEVVSPTHNVSSSFSCPVCCPDQLGDLIANPSSFSVIINGSTGVYIDGVYVDCSGHTTWSGHYSYSVSWWCQYTSRISFSGSSNQYTCNGLSTGSSNFSASAYDTVYDNDGMDCYARDVNFVAPGSTVVIDLAFQKSDGSALPSTLRVGITANGHDRKQHLRAVVDPSSEAANITISVSSKLQLSNVSTSGGIITFDVVGATKSDSRGDSTITARHSSGTTFTKSTSVVVPAQVGTPHDTTGGGVVIANRALNVTTLPPIINVPSSQVDLVTIYSRALSITSTLDKSEDKTCSRTG